MLKGASEVAMSSGGGGCLCRGRGGQGELAKREQFVISLLDVAEIFKIN